MDDGAAAAALTQAAREKLRQTVAKIEKLEEEKKEVINEANKIYNVDEIFPSIYLATDLLKLIHLLEKRLNL